MLLVQVKNWVSMHVSVLQGCPSFILPPFQITRRGFSSNLEGREYCYLKENRISFSGWKGSEFLLPDHIRFPLLVTISM